MRRSLAAVLAVGLVAGAVVVRSLIDNKVEESKGPIRLACSPELADVCRQVQQRADERVEVIVEAPALTADRLTKLVEATASPIDAWLAPQPWASAVNDGRTRNGQSELLDATGSSVARTPLLLVLWKDRAQALAAPCGPRSVTWKCLGELAGKAWTDAGGQAQWGRVKVGHTGPGRDGVGTLALGQAVAGYFGRTDLSNTDLESDDAYAAWVRNLERQVQATGANNGLSTPLERMATQRQSAYDVVAATEAQVASLFSQSPTFAAAVTAVYPEPTATADLQPVVVRDARGADRARDLVSSDVVREVLDAAAWRTAPGDVPVGAPSGAPTTLPDSDGLPSDGLLERLYRTWKDT